MCRKNAYDGEPEYLVTIKETGTREEERSQEEIHRSVKKALQSAFVFFSEHMISVF